MPLRKLDYKIIKFIFSMCVYLLVDERRLVATAALNWRCMYSYGVLYMYLDNISSYLLSKKVRSKKEAIS
jgi:hypothetical protein